MLPASSPAHFLVTLSGFDVAIPGAFMTKEGGDGDSEVMRFRPGGTPQQEVTGGPPEDEDITVSREWRPDRDPDVYKWARQNRGQARGFVSVQNLTADYTAVGTPLTYSALLVGASAPGVDSNASGGDPAVLELRFATYGEVA